MVVLGAVALVPLWSAYETTAFGVAGAAGLLLGAGIAVLGVQLRWKILTHAVAALGAYLLFGGVLTLRSTTLAGVIPTVSTVTGLLGGIVQSWKQLLTVPTPVVGVDTVLVVPLLCGLVAGLLGSAFAVRLRHRGWAVVPSAAVLVTAITFSTFRPVVPIAIGTVFAVIGILWTSAGSRTSAAGAGANLAGADLGERRAGQRRRLGGAAVVIVGGLVVGTGVSAVAPPAASRAVLREAVTPPLNIYDYTSPLESFRKDVGVSAKTALFSISGLPRGARIRLATLDMYDGVVYKVAGTGSSGSGTFAQVGSAVTADPTTVAPSSQKAKITVTLHALGGNWLPDVGYATSLGFDGSGALSADQLLHYDSATGTAVSTTLLGAGTRYTEDTVVPPQLSAAVLSKASIAPVSTPAPQNVPNAITQAVQTATKGASTPMARVQDIATWLSTTGFFSHGLAGQVPSRSGHTSERIGALLAGPQMIGDDEQYSVTMALMVAHLGIPVRVVMGFEPKPSGSFAPVTVTGSQVHSWVEVPLTGLGWVAFDPTPSAARVPHQQQPLPQSKPQADVPQPPPPVQNPAALPAAPPVHHTPKPALGADWGWLWAGLRWGGISLVGLLFLLGPSIALAVVQARRRRRRLRAGSGPDRIHGGWSELVDTAADLGTPGKVGATRREEAATLVRMYPDLALTALARRADDAVFGPGDPSPADVDQYLAEADALLFGLRRQATLRRRIRARIAPRSVLRDVRSLPRPRFRRSWKRGHRD